MRNRIRQLACLLAFGALAWPSPAEGKQGAMLDPQLAALPVDHPTRAQLLILPAYRNSPFGPRQVTPVPAAGSVPVVTLSMTGTHATLRFTGTPLDRQGHSVVWITLPASVAAQRWKVWVRAGGQLYPDLIDSATIDQSLVPPAAIGRAAEIRPPVSAARPHAGGLPAWPFLSGGVALAAAACAVALSRARRAGRIPPRAARR